MNHKTILDMVQETAKGLHKASVMDTTTMRDFDALCLPPVKSYTAHPIKKLRLRYKASQAVFPAYLPTSPSTVQKWEQGQKKPNGPLRPRHPDGVRRCGLVGGRLRGR